MNQIEQLVSKLNEAQVDAAWISHPINIFISLDIKVSPMSACSRC